MSRSSVSHSPVRTFPILASLTCTIAASILLAAPASGAARPSVPFVLNEGSHPSAVRFYAQTFGGTVFVTEHGTIRYALPRADRTGGSVLDEQFVGAHVSNIEAGMPSSVRLSVFIGNDPSKWRSSAPCFDGVSLGEVYDGIRVDLRAYGKNVEKLFTVAPGAKADRIAVRIEGGTLCLDESTGELVVETSQGEVRFTRPIAFQEENGVRTPVDVAYRIDGHAYGFDLGDYDASRPVIIDPLLASTFLGGGDEESGGGLAVNLAGNVYVAGGTTSFDFPSPSGTFGPPDAFDPTNFNVNAYVSMLDASLSNLLASALFGGDGSEFVTDIALGLNGRLYVAGLTYSTNFPATAGAFSETNNSLSGDGDAFVAELDPSLTSITAATYLGGEDFESAAAVAVDWNGSVYVAGRTESTNFPVGVDDYQQEYHFGPGEFDGFLTRFDADLTAIQDSTYFGGAGSDIINALAVGNDNHAYIGGTTTSPDLPTTFLGYDRIINSPGDGFIAVFTTNLNELISGTFLGGDSFDSVSALIAGAGVVYAAGTTWSDNFPVTPDGFDTSANGQLDRGDMFIAKLDLILHNVMAATFLGGTLPDGATAITMNTNGNIVVAGYSASRDFPTEDESTFGGGNTNEVDVVVASLTPNLSILTYARYLGSDESDFASDIARGPNGAIYVSGITEEEDEIGFPTTPGAFDTVMSGNNEAFIALLDLTAGNQDVPYDFDDDDLADMTVFFQDTANWYIRQSATTTLLQRAWGWNGTIPVAADYDGDTVADIAVYFPGNGTWYILRSSDGQPDIRQWGWFDGYPIPADYDGDGKADLAVYEKATATWYIWQSGNNQMRQRQWGWDTTVPVPGDYNGDGIDDIAAYDPGQAVWYVLDSANDTMLSMQWGYGGVEPVPSDYDGDGLTDIAVFDRANAVWFVALSATDTLGGGQWGWNGVHPVPADYDGDGMDDITVYHQDSGGWYSRQSSDGELGLKYWGWFDAEPVILQNQINGRLPLF